MSRFAFHGSVLGQRFAPRLHHRASVGSLVLGRWIRDSNAALVGLDLRSVPCAAASRRFSRSKTTSSRSAGVRRSLRHATTAVRGLRGRTDYKFGNFKWKRSGGWCGAGGVRSTPLESRGRLDGAPRRPAGVPNGVGLESGRVVTGNCRRYKNNCRSSARIVDVDQLVAAWTEDAHYFRRSGPSSLACPR